MGGYGWALLKMVLALGAVCVLLYVALRVGLRRLGGGRGSAQLEVIDRCVLAPGRGLYLVRVGQRRLLLVGASDRGVDLLTEIDDAELRSAGEVGEGTFAALLRRARGAKQPPPSAGQP